MPSLRYALEKGEPRRLVISWNGGWKNVTIYLDEVQIGSIADKKELEAGQQFPLGDDILEVRLDGKKLLVFKNAQPLVADPTPQLGYTCGVIFFIAIFNIVLGLVAELLQVEFIKQFGLNYISVILGGVFLTLGFFVMRRSTIALGIGVGLYALDAIMVFIAGIYLFGAGMHNEALSTILIGLGLRLVFLAEMSKGFRAIRELKEGW